MAKVTVESLCQKAQEAVARGQPEEARQFYLQALSLRSDSPEVHYGLATVCFLLGDLTGAAYHFKEVTRLDPLRAGAYINLGAVYNRLDQLDEAIPVLRRGIQLDMNRGEGYYNLGLVYKRKGQPDLAIQAYREATRVNPRMADAHYNLANLYLEKNQIDLAVAHYRQAIELRPNWEMAQHGLEQARLALQEAEKAQAAPPAQAAKPPQPAPPTPLAVLDPERVLDPQVHGGLLDSLHRVTIETENHGRNFLKILEGELEPAIQELSRCILLPDGSGQSMDQKVQKLEEAVANMRQAKENLQLTMAKVRQLGEKLLQS